MKEMIKLTQDKTEIGMRKSLIENIASMLSIDKIGLVTNTNIYSSPVIDIDCVKVFGNNPNSFLFN